MRFSSIGSNSEILTGAIDMFAFPVRGVDTSAHYEQSSWKEITLTECEELIFGKYSSNHQYDTGRADSAAGSPRNKGRLTFARSTLAAARQRGGAVDRYFRSGISVTRNAHATI